MAIFENKVITRYTADVSGEVQAIDSLIRKNQQLKDAEKQAAADREKHFDQLVLDVSRAQRAENELADDVRQRMSEQKAGAQDALAAYGKLTAGIGLAVAAAGMIVNVIEHWHELEDKLADTHNAALKFVDGARDVNQVIEEQVQLAHNLRQPLHDTMGLYDGVRDAMEGLNFSHREQITLAEQLGKAAIIEGKSIEQAGEFIKKLSITMSLGKDAGKLLKGLMEEMPSVAAVWVEKYGGSNKAFIEQVESGKVKFEDLVGSMIKGNDGIDASFNKRKRTHKEWTREFIETQERLEGSGQSAYNSTIQALYKFDNAEKDNQITTVEWAENVAAELARIEAKFKKTFEFDAPAALKFTTSAMAELLGGLPNLARVIDPWANAAKDDVIKFEDDDMSDDVRALREKNKAAGQRAWEAWVKETAAERADFIQQTFAEENAKAAARMRADADINALAGASRAVQGSMPSGDAYNMFDIDHAIKSTGAQADAALAKANEGAYGEFAAGQANSKMEKIFGPIDDIDAYGQAFGKLGETFTAFGEAVGSSYEAIVTGQGSASAAFKKVMADGLMAIGKSSVVSALRETALGFGALAFGSPTAAMHFKSAGLHAAVAVAAGAAASQLGTSAQGAAADKAASEKARDEEKAKKDREKSGGVDSGKGGGSSRPVYVLIGEAFSDMSPRMKAAKADEAVDKAMRLRDE